MSWQKCPVCNGAGEVPGPWEFANCPTCQGMRIIHSVTGKPPVSKSELKRLDCVGVVDRALGTLGKSEEPK